MKKAWTQKYWTGSEHVHFDQPALEATLLDYIHEVEHVAERIVKLEKAIDEAVEQAPPEMRAVIEALQALRGVAKITAVTIVAELGSLSRFENPRQLMGYSGLVSREYSSGKRIRRGTHHQNRQCPPATGDCGSGVGVSAPAIGGRFLLRRQKNWR